MQKSGFSFPIFYPLSMSPFCQGGSRPVAAQAPPACCEHGGGSLEDAPVCRPLSRSRARLEAGGRDW
jgi:hypothetical protein